FSSSEGVDSVLRDGPWMIREIPIFLNKWSPTVSLLKEELSRVPVWVKFHDVLLVAYTSDGLSLIATKIDTQ
ncbi:zinc knuckle CX2CX4HX4C containing protein, partial [Tanacetum coccineum]